MTEMGVTRGLASKPNRRLRNLHKNPGPRFQMFLRQMNPERKPFCRPPPFSLPTLQAGESVEGSYTDQRVV